MQKFSILWRYVNFRNYRKKHNTWDDFFEEVIKPVDELSALNIFSDKFVDNIKRTVSSNYFGDPCQASANDHEGVELVVNESNNK